jgi:plasmid stabilization system protein ParE
MADVVWTGSALANVVAIRRYVAKFNPKAAFRLAERLIEAGDQLATLPERGRVVKANTREIVAVYPYFLRYRIDGDTVTILRIRHGMMRQ